MIPKALQEKKQDILAYVKSLGISISTPDQEENLLIAFTHKSFSADCKNAVQNNERLEFVGDGILGATINKMLFLDYPAMDESELTLYKIALVRQEMLAEVARDISLDKYLFLSKGEEKMHGREKDAILSDGLEALI
jgi:ribonuclease III